MTSLVSNGACSNKVQKKGGFGTALSPKVMDEERLKTRTHNGLPLISEEEFRAAYRTKSDSDTVVLFDFRGYIQTPNGRIEYRDVTATNGLRGGIHIGIDGVIGYWGAPPRPDGPHEVGEYNAYIIIPGKTQKAEGVLCRNDDCMSVAEFVERERNYMSEGGIQEEIDRYPSGEGYIVVRLRIDPKEDPRAREKVSVLALAINKYIQEGLPLEGLSGFIRAAESHIMSGTAMVGDEMLLQSRMG
jgi:hypothetical protein